MPKKKEIVNTRDKVLGFESSIRSMFVGRNSEIHACILALLSRTSLLLVGPSGTAKSQIVRAVGKGISRTIGSHNKHGKEIIYKPNPGEDPINYFSDICFEAALPDAILGPINPALFASGEFRRNVEGYAPNADIIFIDEVFHSNVAVQHALFGILNERRMRNGSEEIEVPALAVFMAANHIPSSVSQAFMDRICIRKFMRRISDGNGIREILSSWGKTEDGEGFLSMRSLNIAYDEILALPMDTETLDAASGIFLELNARGFDVSERRMKMGLRVAAAEAWLGGHESVKKEHLIVLMDVLCGSERDYGTVAQSVFTRIDERLVRLSGMLNSIRNDQRDANKWPPSDGTLPRLMAEAEKIAGEIEDGPIRACAANIIGEIKAASDERQ